MKPCKVCGEVKPLSEYYKHPKMSDGHLGKCKECQKAASNAARLANLEEYRAYDRSRSNLPHRVEMRAEYQKTLDGQDARRRASSSYNARNPVRTAATTAVRNAVRGGRLIKLPCWECGSTNRIEGHHPAYSMPLDVIWLCKSHHQQLHNEHDEIERTSNSR